MYSAVMAERQSLFDLYERKISGTTSIESLVSLIIKPNWENRSVLFSKDASEYPMILKIHMLRFGKITSISYRFS